MKRARKPSRVPPVRRNPGGKHLATALGVLQREGVSLPIKLAVALSELPRGSVRADVMDHHGHRELTLYVVLPPGEPRRRTRRGLLGSGRKVAPGEPSEMYAIVTRELAEFAASRGLGMQQVNDRRRPSRLRESAKDDPWHREYQYEQTIANTLMVFGGVDAWRQTARRNPSSRAFVRVLSIAGSKVYHFGRGDFVEYDRPTGSDPNVYTMNVTVGPLRETGSRSIEISFLDRNRFGVESLFGRLEDDGGAVWRVARASAGPSKKPREIDLEDLLDRRGAQVDAVLQLVTTGLKPRTYSLADWPEWRD